VAKVDDDIGRRFSFHTAISSLQELVNQATRAEGAGELDDEGGRLALVHACRRAVSLLLPFAPHVACELWEGLGGERLWSEPWPEPDERFMASETVTIVVQVNGKLRDRLEAPAGAPDSEVAARARELERVRAAIDGREIVREVVVPDRLVNLVVRDPG
jgi:leucyl-tRNA synthetase